MSIVKGIEALLTGQESSDGVPRVSNILLSWSKSELPGKKGTFGEQRHINHNIIDHDKSTYIENQTWKKLQQFCSSHPPWEAVQQVYSQQPTCQHLYHRSLLQITALVNGTICTSDVTDISFFSFKEPSEVQSKMLD